MILKVHDADVDQWIFIDGIVEFQTGKGYFRRVMTDQGVHAGVYKTKGKDGKDNFGEIGIDSAYIPASWIKSVSEGDRQRATVKIAFMSLQNGKRITIAFGCSGFLLNDEGKTIERL